MEEKGIVEKNEELHEKNENTGKERIKLGIHSLSKFVEKFQSSKERFMNRYLNKLPKTVMPCYTSLILRSFRETANERSTF